MMDAVKCTGCNRTLGIGAQGSGASAHLDAASTMGNGDMVLILQCPDCGHRTKVAVSNDENV